VVVGALSLLVSLPAAAEECQRKGRAVSEDALCCNVKRVQRCAGVHGWADYPVEVCDSDQRDSEPVDSEPGTGQPQTASGCCDCEGDFHGPGQAVRNAGHKQICQEHRKWKAVELLKQ
jgi:hypothetical protein